MIPTTPSSCASTTSLKPWSSPAGTTSSISNNSPRMGIRHQRSRNKRKFTRWRQCDSCSVLTIIDTVSYWSSWGIGTTWAGINIPLRPHWPWIFSYLQRVGFAGINNPSLTIIVAVEEAVNKNDASGTLFPRNYRETPRDLPKRT